MSFGHGCLCEGFPIHIFGLDMECDVILGGHREELTRRIKAAGAAVFSPEHGDKDLLLRDEVLESTRLTLSIDGGRQVHKLSLESRLQWLA